MRKTFTQNDIEQIIFLYNEQKLTQQQIAEQYGCSQVHINES